jgi:predicted DCC family thiol-disulfide oxidoreductase YuxK
MTANERIVLFDGVCNLCNGWVRFILRHDRHRRFKLAPLQSPAGEALLERHRLGNADSIVLIEDGAAFARSSAVVRILRRLPFPWNLGWLGWIVPRPLRDAIYSWVGRNRYRWFGRLDRCPVPGSDIADRFL